MTRGNFRAIGETDEVVVTVGAKLAVEQLASGDLKRLNELSGLDVSNVCHPFSRENGKKETYEPDNDQITVSNFSVLRPHLAWRLLRKRKRLHYSVGKGRGVATSVSHVDNLERDSVAKIESVQISLTLNSPPLFCTRAHSKTTQGEPPFVLLVVVSIWARSSTKFRAQPSEWDKQAGGSS